MKEKIKRIPVLGHLLQMLMRIVKSPKTSSYLQRQLVVQQEQLAIQQEQLAIQQEQLAVLQERIINQQCQSEQIQKELTYQLYDNKGLTDLNLRLSIHPVIWGDEFRLHISPLAAVHTCFFNVNSGEITIGDYTFAGSNVSILAGSHDMYLSGFLRREVEYTDGCDIVIGQGVWLGANSTILGPCEIGDDAVIAAGAVVTPGMVIASGTVYAGVPAKKVKQIGLVSKQDDTNEHIIAALERRRGVLPVDGWSERSGLQIGEMVLLGYYFVGAVSSIYTTHNQLSMFYEIEDITQSVEISIDVDGQTTMHLLKTKRGIIDIELPSDSFVHCILISRSNLKNQVFAKFWNANDEELKILRKGIDEMKENNGENTHQILLMHETICQHDAVGNDIEAMYHILKEGYEVNVFAVSCKNPNLPYVQEAELERIISNSDNIIIYHHSVYWEKGYEILKRAKCRIVFRYHNITPANFFGKYSRPHYDVCKQGRELTITLQREFPNAFWLSDSAYNSRDLFHVPDEQIIVVPPFHKIEDWGATTPDQKVVRELEGFSGTNFLFVGRIVPNKGYLMLIEILHQYCENYDGNVRLRIIGKAEDVMSPFIREIQNKIKRYHLTEKIEFIGEVTDETLTAYYKGSDVMLCCSAHEGFCVPIVEAQYFGLPVIAMRYCAVPETLGVDEALVGYDVEEFAARIHQVVSNQTYQDHLIQLGIRNYQDRFTYSKIKKTFIRGFQRIIEDGERCKSENLNHVQELGKIAFVSPWFGENIPGGAEMELRVVARHLHQAGIQVEILTTQVKQFASNWNENYYPEGTEYIWDIPVVRFPVRQRDEVRFNQVNAKLMRGESLTGEEENVFCTEMVNSPELYKYIRRTRDYYDFFVFIPYMFGTTYYGIRECYDKAVLIPCLHEESYAYMEQFRREFSKVAGMIYNAQPEQTLANELYDLSDVKQIVMGIGMDMDLSYDAARFRNKYGISEPFLLYAGRKDSGKGVDELIEYFCTFKKKKNVPLKLVLIGGERIDIPSAYQKDVIDLGFVDAQDKYDAYSAALLLCQLSKHESFSFVIMESWLCERPVMVHKDCNVTSYFAEQFQGGYVIGDYASFEEAVNDCIEHPNRATAMGQNGRTHVKELFSWNVIVEKYLQFFKELKAENRPIKVDVENYMETFRMDIEGTVREDIIISLPKIQRVKNWLKTHFKQTYLLYKRVKRRYGK